MIKGLSFRQNELSTMPQFIQVDGSNKMPSPAMAHTSPEPSAFACACERRAHGNRVGVGGPLHGCLGRRPTHAPTAASPQQPQQPAPPKEIQHQSSTTTGAHRATSRVYKQRLSRNRENDAGLLRHPRASEIGSCPWSQLVIKEWSILNPYSMWHI